MSLKLSVNTSEFRDALRKRFADVQQRAVRAVQVTQIEAVNYAKSTTGHMVAGATVNSAGNYIPVADRKQRKSHPGGWADVTSNLVNSIQAGEITITAVGVRGEFGVSASMHAVMEYAEILDQRDGYDVLGGAGVVARKALEKHAKEIVR